MNTHAPATRGNALAWLVLLLVALALAAAAFVFWSGDSKLDAGHGKSEAAKSAASTAEGESAVASRKPSVPEPIEAQRSEKGISFSVLCLGPGGASEPLSQIEITAAPSRATGRDLDHQVTARTDDKGVAQFSSLPYTLYEVDASPAGFVPLTAGAKDGQRVELLFRKGPPLTGIVTDSVSGAPIPDAWVRIRSDFGYGLVARRMQMALRQGVARDEITGAEGLDQANAIFQFSATTDAQGRFTVHAVPSGTKSVVSIDHDEFDPYVELVDVKDSTPQERTFALLPRTEIFGKVVADDTGEPIPGAKVLAGEDGLPVKAILMFGAGSAAIYESVSDANGNYRLKKISRGKQHLNVQYPGYEEYNGSFEVSGKDAFEHEIRLKRAAGISGQVLDNANNPIEGVSLYWMPADANVMGTAAFPKDPHARTAADGTFKLRKVPVGKVFDVVAKHPQFVTVKQDHFLLQPGEEMSGVQVVMNRGGQITGEVLDSMRQPIAGAIIVANPVKPFGSPLSPVTSAPDGSFVVSNTQPAMFEVTCEAPGYVKAATSNVRDFATGVQFLMVKEAIYSGRFVDGSGEPIKKFRIRIRPSERAGDRALRTEPVRNKEGNFEIKGLAPGLWDFEFTAENVTPLVLLRIAVREGERIENQDLRVEAGASVGGVVKSLSGKPIQAALVRMEFLESFSEADKSYADLQTSTNSSGEYEIKHLLAGRYKMWVTHPAFAPSGDRELVVEYGPRVQSDFNLPKPSSLRLIVRDLDGNTVPGARAFLFKGDSPLDSAEKVSKGGMVGLKLPVTDPAKDGIGSVTGGGASRGGPFTPVGETGEASFTRKEPGDWTLWVMADGYYKYTARLALESGKESVHEAAMLKLEPGVSQHDAYRKKGIDPRKERVERRNDQTTRSGKQAATESLTPEQRLVIKKQRDGEELTAEEMKIFKEARRILNQAEAKEGAVTNPPGGRQPKEGRKGGKKDGEAAPAGGESGANEGGNSGGGR